MTQYVQDFGSSVAPLLRNKINSNDSIYVGKQNILIRIHGNKNKYNQTMSMYFHDLVERKI